MSTEPRDHGGDPLELMTVAEIARRLKVSGNTVRNIARRQGWTTIPLGDKPIIRYRRSEVEAHLDAQATR